MSLERRRIIIRFKKKKKGVRRVGAVFLLQKAKRGSERGEEPPPT
jgi:hypothetical protein